MEFSVLQIGVYFLKEEKLKMGKLNSVSKNRDSSSATCKYPLLKVCVCFDFVCYTARIEHI